MTHLLGPVVIAVILERATNIAMGTGIDKGVRFEGIFAMQQDIPMAIVAMFD